MICYLWYWYYSLKIYIY